MCINVMVMQHAQIQEEVTTVLVITVSVALDLNVQVI